MKCLVFSKFILSICDMPAKVGLFKIHLFTNSYLWIKMAYSFSLFIQLNKFNSGVCRKYVSWLLNMSHIFKGLVIFIVEKNVGIISL